MPLISPDFCDHWKTRLLIQLTGNEAAPLAVIRLWCHCHNCKRYEFPKMTAQQLSSICHWRIRKLSCEDALVQAGFLDKLLPNGYGAHGFRECNAGLCQRWESGSKGGRPSESKKDNENAASDETGRKPDDNRRVTGKEPINQPTNQPINPNKPTNQPTSAVATLTPMSDPPPTGRTDSDSSKVTGSDGRTDGLTEKLASKMRVLPFTKPDEQTVFTYLDCLFSGAGRFAKPFLKAMTKSHWKDRYGQPVQDWKAMAKEYANAAARNQIGQP